MSVHLTKVLHQPPGIRADEFPESHANEVWRISDEIIGAICVDPVEGYVRFPTNPLRPGLPMVPPLLRLLRLLPLRDSVAVCEMSKMNGSVIYGIWTRDAFSRDHYWLRQECARMALSLQLLVPYVTDLLRAEDVDLDTLGTVARCYWRDCEEHHMPTDVVRLRVLHLVHRAGGWKS